MLSFWPKPSGMIIIAPQKHTKTRWATSIKCVDPVVSEKIEVSWDNLPPSAQTQQSHAQVMPHHFYPRNARIQNIREISDWILHVVTLEAWKTNTNQNILHHLASIGIPTKPRARVTTWPVQNHVISFKLWSLGETVSELQIPTVWQSQL